MYLTLASQNGKISELTENISTIGYDLETLLFSLFSTIFWIVPLMPAICSHTTMAPGLLTPLKERLLDYHATINLAGCSRLLPRSSFASIKYQMLVTPDIPYCSYQTKGLGHFSSFLIRDLYL